MGAVFAIDSLPERAHHYRNTHAIVVIDVFRASTTIVTGLAAGRRVYPVATVEEAHRIAARLPGALLAGEQDGIQPPGFDLQNSPSQLERLTDRRPVVLVTSAGTKLLAAAVGAPAVYVACFRNLTATAAVLARRHPRVALIGAGTRGESRAEDQMACAWLGRHLVAAGYDVENTESQSEIDAWGAEDLAMARHGPSASYLRATGQEDDIDFVLTRVDDVDAAVEYQGNQVRLVTAKLASELAS